MAVNLLPWRQRRRARRKRVFVGGLVASFAAAVIVVALMAVYLAGLVHHQQQRNDYLAAHIAELDERIVEVDALRRQRQEILARNDVLRHLWQARSVTVGILDELARTLAPGVHYTALSRSGDGISVRGEAESNDRIAELMRNLRDSPWFGAPNLKRIGGEASDAYGEHTAAFELTFHVEPAVLAGEGD